MTTARKPNPIPVSTTARIRPRGVDGGDVAEAEGEERDAAEVGIDPRLAARRGSPAACRATSAAGRTPISPTAQSPAAPDRQRPEQAEERCPPLLRAEHAGRGGPRRPGVDVECPANRTGAHATRQEHRLERVHQHEEYQQDARHRDDCPSSTSLLDSGDRVRPRADRRSPPRLPPFSIRYATMPRLKSNAATLSRLLRRQIS